MADCYCRSGGVRGLHTTEWCAWGYTERGRLGPFTVSTGTVPSWYPLRALLLAKAYAVSVKSKVVEFFVRREINNQKKEGTLVGKIWSWLDGKKLLLGSVLTILGTVAEQLSVVLPALVGPAKSAQYIGVATAVVGGLHKAYKWYYKE